MKTRNKLLIKCRTQSKGASFCCKPHASFDFALALAEFDIRKFNAPLRMLCAEVAA
jgi:hypothetical protein